MILQIDAGNSRFHWRCLDLSGKPLAGPMMTGAGSYHESADWPADEQVLRIELASVAGQEKHQWLMRELVRFSDAAFYEAQSQFCQCGVRNSYANPEQMGVDRWLAMIAAHHHFPGGVAVVDAGTAVTVDYVDQQGVHLGGYILPGLSMMLASLERDTARVSAAGQIEAGAEPGSSTAACVNGGLAWLWQGMAARLEADCRRMGLARTVVSGGDAAQLAAVSPAAVAQCPQLVFLGMDLYWGR